MRHFKSMDEYKAALNEAIISIARYDKSNRGGNPTARDILSDFVMKIDNDDCIWAADINEIAERLFGISGFDVDKYSCGMNSKTACAGYEDMMLEDGLPELLRDIVRGYFESNTDFLWTVLVESELG